MKPLPVVVFALLGCVCFGQTKQPIPGLIPLSLKKGGYEVNLGASYEQYKKDFDPSAFSGLFQFTYGIFNRLNIGVDATAYSLNYIFADASSQYHIHYKTVSVGPRLRWAIYNSQQDNFNITLQNSILFPFSKIEVSTDSEPEGQRNISNGAVLNNQVTFLYRPGYQVILTLDGYVLIYPRTNIDERKPIDIPVHFLATYALKTNWMIHGILSYTSEFRTIDWDSGSSYYYTGQTLKAGMGVQYSFARGFSVNAAFLAAVFSNYHVPSWSNSNTINLSFRWRP